MGTDQPLVIASWKAPPWSETSTIDEDAVVHSLVLGQTAGEVAGINRSVELVQRDELGIDANTVSITRRPPYLRLAGELIAPQDIQGLARMLNIADDLVGQSPTGEVQLAAAPPQQERVAS